MMNRRKKLLIVLLILAILATFAACGSAENAAPQEGSSDSPSAPVQTKKPGLFGGKKNEPQKVPVTGIELSETELTVYLGADSASGTLSAAVQPENADLKGVSFASSDPAVVQVDEAGGFRALSLGTAVVTVTSEDPEFTGSASCRITVASQVKSIVLSSQKELMFAEDTAELSAQVEPANVTGVNFVWASSDENVATVDENGSVKAVGAGRAVVSYTVLDGSGTQGACEILVGVPIKSAKVNEKAVTVLVGAGEKLASSQLTITTVPEESAFFGMTWSSSNESVATVDENGVVTGVAAGKATITGISNDPKSNGKVKAVCAVTVGDAVQGIELSAASESVQKGRTLKLTAALTPAKPFNAKLTWASSDEAVLTVDAKGTVKAVGVGSATVTCTAADGSEASAKYNITVYQPVTKLVGSTRKLVLDEGKSGKLTVTVSPEDATDKTIQWSSADESIAKVDRNGAVTAVKPGVTTITAAAVDGSKKSITISVVVEPRVPLDAVTFTRSGYFGYYNEFAVTFKNVTRTKRVVYISFKVTYTSGGSTQTVSCYTDSDTINAGQSRRVGWWRRSGLTYAYSFRVYLQSVRYSDGTSQYFSDELIGWFS